MGSGIRIQNGFLSEPISKVLLGQKRSFLDLEETSDVNLDKRVKIRDLESVFRDEAQARKGGSYATDSGKVSNTQAVDVNVDENAACKNNENLKPRDEAECESSVVPANRIDSMRVWEGLKQNNFMSTFPNNMKSQVTKVQTQVPKVQTPMPKPRERKKTSVNNVVTKKTAEFVKREHVDRFSRFAPPSGLLDGINPGIINSVRNSKQVHSVIVALLKLKGSEVRHAKTFALCNEKKLKDRQVMNLSPVTPLIDDASWLSNEEPENSCSDSSLPVEAANVASQWLELLSRDIGGRLEVLRRSKSRVLGVITTDLPLLVSRELSSEPEKENVDAHNVRWSSLFEQMYKSLSEEESDLENWLNQVNELQLKTQSGLNRARLIGPGIRSGEVDDSAIMAAAGSIYSTCKFLSSNKN